MDGFFKMDILETMEYSVSVLLLDENFKNSFTP